MSVLRLPIRSLPAIAPRRSAVAAFAHYCAHTPYPVLSGIRLQLPRLQAEVSGNLREGLVEGYVGTMRRSSRLAPVLRLPAFLPIFPQRLTQVLRLLTCLRVVGIENQSALHVGQR